MRSIMVAKSSPKITLMAMGDHSSPPPVHNGIIPQDVVRVVNRIGLNLSFAAFFIPSSSDLPVVNSVFILSTKTMASLIIIPA